jgi:uncharacterized membrane protein YozB (DUF420 family)
MNTHIITRTRFPSIAVAALAAVTVVGFARTYYLRVLFDLPPLAQAAHIHGIISTLWLALHFTQARLIAAHRVAVHKRLGIFTACVGALLAIQAFGLAVEGVAAGHAPPGRNPLEFLSVPMGTITMFVMFVATALFLRRRSEWHKRFMLLASMALLLPAAGRIDLLIMASLGLPRPVIGFWLTFAFVAWAWLHDWRKLGRIHPAYLIGGIALLVSIPARRALGFTEGWIPVAKWLIE